MDDKTFDDYCNRVYDAFLKWLDSQNDILNKSLKDIMSEVWFEAWEQGKRDHD